MDDLVSVAEFITVRFQGLNPILSATGGKFQ